LEQNPHIALPLEALFVRLEAAGFRMDTARKMRLLRVLEEEGSEVVGDFEGMKYRLAPFIARTPLEQERFYEFFDQFEAECALEAEKLNAVSEAPSPAPQPASPIRKRIHWWWVLLLLATVLVIWFGWPKTGPTGLCQVQMATETEGLLREGDTLVGQNLSNCADSSAYVWEIRDATTGQTEHTDSSFQLQWRAVGAGQDKWVMLRHTAADANSTNTVDSLQLTIHCANPPQMTAWQTPEGALNPGKAYEFSANVTAGVQVEWVFNNTDTLRGAKVAHAFTGQGEATVGLLVYRTGQKDYCYSYVEKKLNIGGKPYLQPFVAKRDYPRMLLQLNRWYWLFACLPLLAALRLLARWWKKRHEKTPEKTVADLEAKYPIHDAGPYFVPYLPQDAKITVPRDFFRMAEVMRRREEGNRRYFDAAASVRATVDAGGYPEWREKKDTRPAEYLFLVQRTDERNQQALLFERLTAFLKRREAPAEVFFHSGRFDVFKNPEHPNGIGLAELKQLYPAHRLILLGDGHGLVNPYNPQTPALLAAPVKVLSSWPRRLLLTPEPVSGWSFQEALLHRHFLICPADTDGMLAGLEMLDRMEEYEPGKYARREAELLRLHPQVSHRYRHWETPDDHKAYLKDHPDWYRWLCALAVCVQPDWALTIAIGRAIGVEVTHDALLALSRIPWLNSNAPDTNLRLALLRQLNPVDEALARKAVAEELERVKGGVAGSFAETEWTTGIAMQRFAIDPHDEGHKDTLRDLKRLGLLSGSQLAELDLIVQEKMDKKGLPARATQDIAAWLEQPAPKPFWTRELIGGMAAMLLSAFLLAYGFYFNNAKAAKSLPAGDAPPTDFWLRTMPLDDQAIQWNNEAVDLWNKLDSLLASNGGRFSYALNERGFTIKIQEEKSNKNVSTLEFINPSTTTDSLLELAIGLRQALYTLADSNRTALRFNFATLCFKIALDTKLSPAGNRQTGNEPRSKKLAKDFTLVSADDTLYSFLTLEEIRNTFATLTRPSVLYNYPTTAYNERSPLCLAALHGRGLCDFYLERRDSAMTAYTQLLALTNNQYFDTLSMPVNLRTLLDEPPIAPEQKKPDLAPESKPAFSKSRPKTKSKTTTRLPKDKVELPPVKQPVEPETVQFAKAIKNGDRQCPEGSSFEGVDGGTCWSCPPGYRRTAARVNEAAACVRAGTTEYSKATNHGNGSGKGGRECDPGQFWDAYNKGTCWSCPDGFNRARSEDFTSERACERVTPEERSSAGMIAAAKCPDESSFDPEEGSCWSCPPNYIRTIYPVNSDQACELKRIKKN